MKVYYHNPRCSKSRTGLSLLEEAKIDFKIKEYLNEPMSTEEVKSIVQKLKVRPHDIIRTKEQTYKDLGLNLKEYSDEHWIQLIVDNPILLERPILVTEDDAVIGRPSENIENFLKK